MKPSWEAFFFPPPPPRRGVLPTMAYIGRFRLKGVPFSGARHMKGCGIHELKYDKRIVVVVCKRTEKANERILWPWKMSRKLHSLAMQHFRLYVKGVLYVKRMYTKGARFLSKWYIKPGWEVVPRRGASPYRTLLSSPPGPHSTRQLHRLVPRTCSFGFQTVISP